MAYVSYGSGTNQSCRKPSSVRVIYNRPGCITPCSTDGVQKGFAYLSHAINGRRGHGVLRLARQHRRNEHLYSQRQYSTMGLLVTTQKRHTVPQLIMLKLLSPQVAASPSKRTPRDCTASYDTMSLTSTGNSSLNTKISRSTSIAQLFLPRVSWEYWVFTVG